MFPFSASRGSDGCVQRAITCDAAGAPSARAHLLGRGPAELGALLEIRGEPHYRAGQILEWVYRRGAASFDEMTNLPKELRAWLGGRAMIYAGRVVQDCRAGDGTRKLLWGWPDGSSVESVLIPAEDRVTACLSSQVGCPAGCRFCASGQDGLQRNLSAGEIVEQALRMGALSEGRRLSNVVLMGMGEPLANYDAVVKAIRILNAPWGLGIGARKITVSTVGLPKQIRRLAREDLQIKLALSLHAADERLRRELIPWAQRVPLAELLDACGYYFQQTGREITLEYVLLEGVNDRAADAAKLAAIAKRLRANVNLLRYNPVAGLDYGRPSTASAHEFQQRLRARSVNAHLRKSRGCDAEAACGQLRRKRLPTEDPVPDEPAN